MNIKTDCVHGPKDQSHGTGAIATPIYQTATFSHLGVGESTGYDYSRLQNPTREHLELVMARLERGCDALAFTSGMSAISALMELFKPGDHLLASNDLYGGSVRLFENISKKNGVEVELVNTSDLKEVELRIKKNTKAIFVETPTNPMMRVTDLKAVGKLVKDKEILLIVDNTFLTPYFQQPLSLGADLVVHSGTKYLGGHNDTLAGFLVTNSEEISEKLRFIYKTTGAVLAPFDSFLITRGIKTLALRMERQEENALTIAKWLTMQDKIKKVFYVGLDTHPDYEVSKQQATGFGAMISFEVISREVAQQILERVKLILFAESLGGVETLITYPLTQTHADVPADILEANGITDSLLRLSVGIEDVEDLIGDLKQALEVGEDD